MKAKLDITRKIQHDALLSLVEDLAVRSGASSARVKEVLRIRESILMQLHREAMEKELGPEAPARYDPRRENDLPEDDAWPELFE